MADNIFLVRHGLTKSNVDRIYAGQSEEGLIEEGIQATEELGRAFIDYPVLNIYSSPLKRAIQTAIILNKYVRGTLIIEPDLREMKMGPWEGLTEEEIALKYPMEFAVWMKTPADLRIENRETLLEVKNRALRAIHKITSEDPEKNIVAVTHVAIIRCLYLSFNKLSLNDYKKISVPNSSVLQFTLDRGSSEPE